MVAAVRQDPFEGWAEPTVDLLRSSLRLGTGWTASHFGILAVGQEIF